MPGPSQAKSGGAKKVGRNLAKCARYRSRGRRYLHKMARILQSNGPAAAETYRLAHLRGRGRRSKGGSMDNCKAYYETQAQMRRRWALLKAYQKRRKARK